MTAGPIQLKRVALLASACAFVCAPLRAQDAPAINAPKVVAPSATQQVCVTPQQMSRLDGSLPATARAFRANQPITIIAMGSSSTFGHGSSQVIYTYPVRLGDELVKRWPKHQVKVINRGVSGEDVNEELVRLERDVFADKPQLVIWQVGTNALLQKMDLSAFEKGVQQGIDRIRKTGSDLVLMDLQFVPQVSDAPGHDDMLKLFDRLGKRNHIPVFHRFALMHYWSGQMKDYRTDMVYTDGLHMTDHSYGCMATVLADAIDYAVEPGNARADRNVVKKP